jgi:choline kinase
MKALILAAGMGSRLAPLTDDRPKALVEVAGRSFLRRQIDHLVAAGIAPADIVIVGGYRIEAIRAALARDGLPCTVVMNDRYEPWNNFYSVAVAERELAGHDYLQLDGDVLLDDRLLPRVIAAPGEAVLAVDRNAVLDDETMKVQLRLDGHGRVAAVGKRLDPTTCAGEYIGITKLSAAAATAVFGELATFPDEGLTHEYYEGAFDRLIRSDRVPFGIVDVGDCLVIEVDNATDLARAEDLLRSRS